MTRHRPLSARQEAFCLARAAGFTLEEAGKRAGYKSPPWVRKMVNTPPIQARIAEIQEGRKERADLHAIARLEERVNALGALYEAFQPKAVGGDAEAAKIVMAALDGAAKEVGGRVQRQEMKAEIGPLSPERRQQIAARLLEHHHGR